MLRSSFVLALLAGVACSQSVAQKVVPDPRGPYWGLYNIGSVDATYDDFTELSDGIAPPITFTFHDWNAAGVEATEPVLQTFRDPMESSNTSVLEMAERVAEDGGVLAVAWESVGYFFEHPDYFAGGGSQPITWDDVLSGVYDDHIRTVAAEVKELGVPIMLSPAGEFNSIGYFSFGPGGDQPLTEIDDPADLGRHYGDPATPDGPERMRDLFRHVIDVFDEEGVTNVTWFMYSHSGYMNPDEFDDGDPELLESLHPRHYYPGDDYIDWIGGSIYVDADDPESGVESAAGDALRAWDEVTDKPFFSPEFGVLSVSEVDRAMRMRRLFDDELLEYDQIRAFALADGELWSQFFDIPRLGHTGEELDAWRESVIHNPGYVERVRTVPEPSGLAVGGAGFAFACVVLRRRSGASARFRPRDRRQWITGSPRRN